MGTTAEKLNYLKETKTEIKNALETPSNIFRDYPNLIKKYIDNQPTKVVSDGVCGNALDLPAKLIEVDGNNEQKTYSGKNLAYTDWAEEFVNRISDIQKVKIETKDGKKCLYYRGDAGGGNYNAKYLFKTNWKENTQYTISFDIYPSEKYANILLEYTDGTTSYPAKWGWLTVQQWQHLSATSDSNKTIKYIRCEYASGFDYIDIDTFMVKESSVGDDTYEPHTGGMPSPNPSYPQKIEVIDGCNMIDMSTVSKNYYISSVNGSVVRVDDSYNTLATDFIEVKEGEKYYFSGMNLFNNGNTGAMYNSKKEFVSGISSDYDIRPITIPSGVKYLRLSIWGNKYDVPTNPKPVLAKGTTQKPYGKYGCVGVEQSGKNKFDNFKEYSYSNSNINATSLNNGIKIEKKGGFGLWVFDNLENLDGKIVRAKSKFNDGGSIVIGLASLDGTSRTSLKENTKSDTVSSFVIPKITDNKKYLAVWLYGTDNSEISYEDLIVTIDNEDMTYEPYHETKVIQIDLQGNTLAKVGDIKDKLKIYRNGNIEIEKRVGKYVFTGDEYVALNSNINGSIFYGNFISDKSANNTEMVCNNFLYESNKTWQQISNYGFCGQKGSNNIFIRNDDYTNLVDFKAYLRQQYNAGTPAHIFYELSEPQTIKLPSISPIELWQGTNIFKLITNLDTTFEVEYVVDKESILNEVQAAMLEAEIEI